MSRVLARGKPSIKGFAIAVRVHRARHSILKIEWFEAKQFMSDNPEAFEFLRKEAYAFVNKNGKDRWTLLDFCTSSILEWMKDEGSDLSESEALRIAADVTRWTIKKYNPPRPRAARSREQRAAEEVAVTFLYEESAAIHGSPSVRNAARLGGKSKSTVARHLRQQGISPKRRAKVEKLPPKERRLVAILDETFPRDGSGLVLIDELAAALWDDKVSTPTKPLPDIARSTKSTRRKKLAAYLSTISGYGLGFHVVTRGNVVALRRGRRFRDMKEILIWIEDEKQLRGFRGIALPETAENASSGFWDDPWLTCVLTVLEMGLWSYFGDAGDLEPFVRLTHPVIDTRALYPWFWRAINSYSNDGFAENLANLSRKINDPDVRKAVSYVAHKIARIRVWAQYSHPVDYFNDVDREIAFMNRLRDIAPDSHARCGYLRDVILTEFMKQENEYDRVIWEALQHCKRLRELERSGEWTAPTANELAYHHPDNAPPF